MRFFFCLQLLSLDTGVAVPGGFRRLRQEEVEDARYRKTFLLPRSMGSRPLFQGSFSRQGRGLLYMTGGSNLPPGLRR